MQRSPLVPIIGFGLIGLALIAAVVLTSSFLGSVTGADTDATPAPTSSPSGLSTDPVDATASATPDRSPDVPASAPGTTDAPTAPDPEADPQLALAEFVLRLGSARETADRLMDELQRAAEAGDDEGVRSAALEIAALVETERAWLAAHPPAACYAKAHRDADAMYVAFGVAADRAVAWADADGLAAIPALIEALDAVAGAIEDAQDLTAELGTVDCG